MRAVRRRVENAAEAIRREEQGRIEIGVLPALVLPALERGGQEVEFGKDVAQPRREQLAALARTS